MIQPVKLNSNTFFKGTEQSNNIQVPENSEAAPKNVLTKAKNGFVGVLKDINTVKDTSQGALRGLGEGMVGAVVIGSIGKNIKQAENRDLWKVAKGLCKDAKTATVNLIKSAPKLLTKSPLENLKSVATAPKNFYKNYLSGNKAAKFAATTAGVGILALRTLQGKMNANMDNANVDHRFNRGHVDN